ncbi:reverse transcriptase N-terminal domain-containing protein [Paraburkholderia humisilvae]|uniref:reverse transcriptase N-terminal domain-containing protein n=1 Tax=Paraburkholderia humisilvae TaxID=627669 RepID=UPI003606AE9A
MTANDTKVSNAGAPSHAARMWDQANWSHIETEVKRLQMRIAKAVREGRWCKAKVLQRLLTRSHSGKMLAVKRVTENRGKRTPGGRQDMVIPVGQMERNAIATSSRLSCDAAATCLHSQE